MSTRRSGPRDGVQSARGASCRAASGPSTCSASPGSSRSGRASSRSSNRWTPASRSRSRATSTCRSPRPTSGTTPAGRTSSTTRSRAAVATAAGRRGPDHPVELPAADAGLEDRPGARGRQHGRPQAGLDHARSRALLFADVCRQADLPPGVVNIITGPGEIGMALVDPPRRRQGRLHRLDRHRQEDRTGVAGTDKALTLELGGKAANIVFDDAPLDQAIEGIVNGIYFNQGEVCCAGSRLLVQESIAETAHRQAQGPTVDDPGRATRSTRTPTSARSTRRPSSRRSPSSSRPASAEGAEMYQPACDLPDRGYFFRPDAVHERRPEPPHRPRGDLRAGAVGADVPDARRGGREGEQHAVRPVGRGLDRQGQPDPRTWSRG